MDSLGEGQRTSCFPARRAMIGVRGPLVAFVVALLLAPATSACTPVEGDVVPLEVYRERLNAIRTRSFSQTIRILDRNGELLTEIVDEGYRSWAELDSIPSVVRDAAIATEDRTFYANTGVDKRAVARAVIQNARAGGTVSGASTITMQLVRLVAFPPEERFAQSMDRKVREVHLAAELDETMGKDEILEAYLNVAFYGRQAYGIEAASQRFFGKGAAALSLAEGSFLVGLLQAPGFLSPDLNLSGARARQAVVLQSMASAGSISEQEADSAFAMELALVPPPPPPTRVSSHFIDAVLGELPRRLGAAVAATGGYTVQTTLDPKLEERVRDIARTHVESLRAKHDIGDAAVVVLRPDYGEVLAMVGGIAYDDPRDGQVNAAVFPRQPGSAFKPIVYAAALERGWQPATLVWDAPVDFPNGDGTDYQAANYDGRFRGPVRLRDGLANSLNAAAVAVAVEVGVEPIHALAQNMGLNMGDDPWQYGLSLALGGAEVGLTRLTGALGAFGNGGVFVEPTTILSVKETVGGATLYRNKAEGRRVVSKQTAWLVSDILDDDAARVPAFGANNPLDASMPMAVKTGTTNDFRDNLTVGWTPWLAVGVWTGNKDGRPMRNVLGITGAAPIWRDTVEAVFSDPALMSMLGDGTPPRPGFPVPSGITRANVCDLNILLRERRCQPRGESFAAGGPTRDEALAFGYFNGIGDCGSRVDGPNNGRMALLAPRHAVVAASVRGWWRGRSIPVAPPSCGGAGGGNGAHSPTLGASRAIRAVQASGG